MKCNKTFPNTDTLIQTPTLSLCLPAFAIKWAFLCLPLRSMLHPDIPFIIITSCHFFTVSVSVKHKHITPHSPLWSMGEFLLAGTCAVREQTTECSWSPLHLL